MSALGRLFHSPNVSSGSVEGLHERRLSAQKRTVANDRFAEMRYAKCCAAGKVLVCGGARDDRISPGSSTSHECSPTRPQLAIVAPVQHRCRSPRTLAASRCGSCIQSGCRGAVGARQLSRPMRRCYGTHKVKHPGSRLGRQRQATRTRRGAPPRQAARPARDKVVVPNRTAGNRPAAALGDQRFA